MLWVALWSSLHSAPFFTIREREREKERGGLHAYSLPLLPNGRLYIHAGPRKEFRLIGRKAKPKRSCGQGGLYKNSLQSSATIHNNHYRMWLKIFSF